MGRNKTTSFGDSVLCKAKTVSVLEKFKRNNFPGSLHVAYKEYVVTSKGMDFGGKPGQTSNGPYFLLWQNRRGEPEGI